MSVGRIDYLPNSIRLSTMIHLPKQLVNDLLEALHALHIFSARLGNRRVGEIYLVAFEILWLLTSASFVSHTQFFFLHVMAMICFDSLSLLNHPLAKLTHHNLHHRQMFQIVVCLKKRVSSVELYQDTAYTEHVTRIRP